MSNYTHTVEWVMITHPCIVFNDCFCMSLSYVIYISKRGHESTCDVTLLMNALVDRHFVKCNDYVSKIQYRDVDSLRYWYCSDVIISAMASQITIITIAYSAVYSGANQRTIKAQSHWPLCGDFACDRWIPRKRASNSEMFPFDDVIMLFSKST